MSIIKVADFHYYGNGSDKVYHVALESDDILPDWYVKKAHGRRGNVGLITSVSYAGEAAAREDYDKTVKDKTSKGSGVARFEAGQYE